MDTIELPIVNSTAYRVEIQVFDQTVDGTPVVEHWVLDPGQSCTVTLGPGRCISTFLMVPVSAPEA